MRAKDWVKSLPQPVTVRAIFQTSIYRTDTITAATFRLPSALPAPTRTRAQSFSTVFLRLMKRAEFHDIQFKMLNPKCKGKRRGRNKKRGEKREVSWTHSSQLCCKIWSLVWSKNVCMVGKICDTNLIIIRFSTIAWPESTHKRCACIGKSVLILFFLTWHKVQSSRKMESQLRKIPSSECPIGKSVKEFS